jgi:hypothetical protein
MRTAIVVSAAAAVIILAISLMPASGREESGAVMTEDQAIEIAENFLLGEGVPDDAINGFNAADDDECWTVNASLEMAGEDIDVGVKVDKMSGEADWE